MLEESKKEQQPKRPKPKKKSDDRLAGLKMVDREFREITKLEQNIPVVEQKTLTSEQEIEILEYWKKRGVDTPTVGEICEHLWPGSNIEGRSALGIEVRKFLGTKELKARRAKEKPKGEYILSSAEEEFIRNNAETMRKFEMAQVLFQDANISTLDRRYKALNNLYKTLDYGMSNGESERIAEGKFVPPKTYFATLKLVNEYTMSGFDTSKISEREKRGVEMLIKYLRAPRFIQSINNYENEENRELFLAEYIRATFDKPDLSNDELNLYINLCQEYIISASAHKDMEALNKKFHEAIESDVDVSMRLSEAMTSSKNKYDESKKRQDKLIAVLNGNRAKRLEAQMTRTQSVLSLVEYWKDAKKRQKMLKVAELRKKLVQSVASELNTMDNIKAEMFGVLDEAELFS